MHVVVSGPCPLAKRVCLSLCLTAERVTSLGKDWHRPCLKCEKCSKTLSAGSHAEHDGKPYCNNPCYSALFGPKGEFFFIPGCNGPWCKVP
uniref:LIM zinc-binding domain-containing protein n=1 Tax=Oncorhynchus mykiss TaxID=8022 RepID=A0A8C7SF83_ONCMY